MNIHTGRGIHEDASSTSLVTVNFFNGSEQSELSFRVLGETEWKKMGKVSKQDPFYSLIYERYKNFDSLNFKELWKNNTDLNQKADNLYQKLKSNNIDVFFDDRNQNPGVKFRDANLMGVPYQVVLGEKTLSDGTVELISRKDQKKEILDFTKIIKRFKV